MSTVYNLPIFSFLFLGEHHSLLHHILNIHCCRLLSPQCLLSWTTRMHQRVQHRPHPPNISSLISKELAIDYKETRKRQHCVCVRHDVHNDIFVFVMTFTMRPALQMQARAIFEAGVSPNHSNSVQEVDTQCIYLVGSQKSQPAVAHCTLQATEFPASTVPPHVTLNLIYVRIFFLFSSTMHELFIPLFQSD